MYVVQHAHRPQWGRLLGNKEALGDLVAILVGVPSNFVEHFVRSVTDVFLFQRLVARFDIYLYRDAFNAIERPFSEGSDAPEIRGIPVFLFTVEILTDTFVVDLDEFVDRFRR